MKKNIKTNEVPLIVQILLLPAAFSFFCSTCVAAVFIVAQGGFGAWDFLPFLLWTLPFMVLVTLAASLASMLFMRLPPTLSYLVAILSGFMIALGWSRVPGLIIGPWVMAFSVPLFPSWAIGAISAMIAVAAAVVRHKYSQAYVEQIFAFIALLLLVWWLASFLANPKITLVFIKWEPSSEPMILNDRSNRLRQIEVTKLRNLNLGGELIVTHGHTEGSGLPSRAVIIMHKQLEAPVELPLPNFSSIIYLQEEDGWRMMPPDAWTLQRIVSLEPAGSSTTFMIELLVGGRSGSGAINWEKEYPK